jgi:hypothetical protein
MRIHSVLLAGCALWLLALSGCTKGGAEKPKLVPVQGTVTMDGQPLVGASVMFGGVALGETDANGHYELSKGKEKGVPAGDYTVVVEKWVNPDGSVYKSAEGVSPMEAGAKQEIPPKYSNAEQSQLKKTVPPEGGTIDLELTSG